MFFYEGKLFLTKFFVDKLLIIYHSGS